MTGPEHSGADDRALSSALARDDDGPPPILKTWPRLYTFVICYLVLLIALFYLFTHHFTP